MTEPLPPVILTMFPVVVQRGMYSPGLEPTGIAVGLTFVRTEPARVEYFEVRWPLPGIAS